MFAQKGNGMIYVRCPHCGKRVESGKKCGCGFKREYTAPQGNKKWYHTARWQKLQKTIMNRYSGLDLYAQQQGRIEYADTVHHIVPAQEAPELFWDPDNLIPLSRSSHDEIHVRYRAGSREKEVCQKELKACVRTSEKALLG